jgi:NADP-dependent 3-hydroxy acid dehydrogenase YdfG
VVVVTGASRGIGAGLVAGYRSLGFGVVATARSITPSKDEQVLAIAGDIRDRATAQKVVAAAKERFGRVDTLVNNAGLFIAKSFTEYTQELGEHAKRIFRLLGHALRPHSKLKDRALL